MYGELSFQHFPSESCAFLIQAKQTSRMYKTDVGYLRNYVGNNSRFLADVEFPPPLFLQIKKKNFVPLLFVLLVSLLFLVS